MSTSYADLVNVSSFGKKREDNFNPERGEVAFYCKDCQKVVDINRLEPSIPQKKKWREYIFQCMTCSGENISVWTVEWLKDFYKR